GRRGALEIADEIDFLGADLSADASVDATSVNLHVPVARLADALAVMADVVARPTFPDAELRRLRDERLASLLEAQDDPEELVALAFPHVVFGTGHRYGLPLMGTASSLNAIAAEDLKAFHAAQFRPSNALLIVVGDVSVDTVVPMLERTLGTWQAPKTAAAARGPDAPHLTPPPAHPLPHPPPPPSHIPLP